MGAAGRHSVTCYEALVHEHPWERKAGDNYGAGTKLVLLSPFTQCFESEEGKSKTKAATGHVFVSKAPRDFQEGGKKKKKITENEINLSAQH